MADTIMSAIGESPQRSGGDENLEPILGDGTAKAGMMVGMLSTGKAVAIDGDSATAGISFLGIMDRSVTIDYDTAITDALINNVIKPGSKRKYDAFIQNETAATAQLKGRPLGFSATEPGYLTVLATLAVTANIVAYLDQDMDLADGSGTPTKGVAHIEWA